ncbi:murein biosynthesis integral membrane protein MurJ, partial [Patescibacteria group bacterium]|nr:murein biosynthesis integral membrane protein MurJ [Patescibacteria group bacterium]MBU1682773.1 murein biosynthesis integral membrane protein MurJ [Patescibacteria group bacterium]
MKRIRHLNILPPTLLLAVTALLSRFLGIARDHLLAKIFGATEGVGIYNLDTYYAAFRIPDLLYNLLIFGAISAAFIPIFTQYKKEGKFQEAWAFASSMLHLMMIMILVIAGVAYIFAPYLVHIVAGGFDEEAFNLTVRLMRIMLLSPILFTLSSVVISIQDSFKCFLFRSIGPLFYNAGIIFGIIYFGEQFGVVGVTWGVIIGALLQLIVQLPALLQVGYKHMWLLGYMRPDVRKAFKLIIPRVLGLSLNQLTLVVNTLIASFLMTGSITIFYLSDNLQALPLGIIAISFAITSFATLSELATEPSTEPFAKEIQRVMQQILFLIIPATLGMLALRSEVIDIILVSGKFSAGDAEITKNVLGFLLISLFAQSLIPLLSRGFYAYHNTKTPVLTAFVGSIVSVGGSLVMAFVLDFGIVGIAIAFSAGAILNFVLLYIFMHRKLARRILDWVNILKMVVAGLLMGAAVVLAKDVLPYGGDLLQKISQLLLLVVIGIAVYFAVARLFKIPEFEMVWRQVR